MRDLAALDGPDLSVLERHHDDGFSVERHELDLEGLARAMHMNHGAHVPGRELVSRQVGRQHNAVVLSIQTVRTFGVRPSGARSRPSTVQRTPWAESSELVTGLEIR